MTIHPTNYVQGFFLRSLASICHIVFLTMVILAGRRRCCNVVLIFIFLVVKKKKKTGNMILSV